MAALVQTTDTKGFQNWLRGALAVLFAKQGLQSFVIDEMTQLQRDLLTSIFKDNKIPTGTICTSCTTENVLYCPTQNFCPKGRQCNMHDPSVPDKTPKPCPNNICDAAKDVIRREHRYNGPSWKNTSAKGWCTDVIEIAKCYMPPDGYTNVKTIAGTDFNGILAVILNNKRFKSKMTAPLNTANNVCTEARAVSNSIRHSADLTISDTDLTKYIDILIRLLSDSTYLDTDQNAKTAVDKLNQLETNTLTIITADIITVLDCKLKDIIEEQRDSARDISEERSKATEEIQDTKTKAKEDIEDKRTKAQGDIEDKATKAKEDIENKKTQAQEDIEDKNTRAQEDIEDKKTKAKEDIENKKTQAQEEIEDKKTRAKEDIEDKKIQAIQQFLDNVKDSLSQMQTVTASNLHKIIESKQSVLGEIQAIAEIERKELKALSRREKQQIKVTADTEKDEFNRVARNVKQELTAISSREGKQLKEAIRKERDKIKSVVEKEKQELTAISKRKKQLLKDKSGKQTGFREDLLNYYRQYYSTIPIAPLVEEHDVELVDFYVQPPLTAIDIEKTFGRFPATPKGTAVNSYHDLFLGHDDKLHKNIYITAKAGIGKTSFVKKICMTWCQAHNPLEKIKQKFKPDDVHVMKQFEYLFVISLRDTNTSICDIDGMIYSQIIDRLAGSHRYSEYFVKEILLHSTSLIVLDGLDEWSHPASCRRGCSNVHEIHIPNRPARERCSVLTTTRPWKLYEAKLRTNQIDKHAEINELDYFTSNQLISNALTVLNKRNLQIKSKTIKEFEAATYSLQIRDIRYIPYILLQMVCLWFDGKSIGKSKCEIYSNVINLTLRKGLMKCGEYVSSLESNYADIPYCLRSNECCKTYHSVLLCLGEIAFQTLFALEEESSLVFDKTLILNFVSEQILGFYLKVGLLSQNKAYGHVSVRQSSFSFQHKSMQEYFAALYLQSEYDSEVIQQKIYNKCKTLAAILQMSNVFIFLGGLKPHACEKILQSLQSTISTDRTTRIYRNIISDYRLLGDMNFSYAMETLQSMYTDIVNEIVDNGLKYVPACLEDILIGFEQISSDKKKNELFQLLIEKNKTKIKSLCIEEVLTAETFTRILHSLGLQDVRSLHKLKIQLETEMRQSELLHLLSGSVHTLTSLSLRFGEKIEHDYNALNTYLATETMKTILSMDQLMSLELAGVCSTHFDIQMLFSFINKKTTMTEILLSYIKCTDHNAECMGYCLDLSKHQNLESLGLEHIVVLKLQADISSLKACFIGQLPVDVYTSLVKNLQHGTCLRTLYIELTEGLLSNVIATLPKLENLRMLLICHSNFRDKSLILSSVNESIEFVTFLKVTMISTVLRKLIDSINVLPQSVTVSLQDCTVIPQEEYWQILKEIRRRLLQYKYLSEERHTGKFYCLTLKTVGQILRQ